MYDDTVYVQVVKLGDGRFGVENARDLTGLTMAELAQIHDVFVQWCVVRAKALETRQGKAAELSQEQVAKMRAEELGA